MVWLKEFKHVHAFALSGIIGHLYKTFKKISQDAAVCAGMRSWYNSSHASTNLQCSAMNYSRNVKQSFTNRFFRTCGAAEAIVSTSNTIFATLEAHVHS
jgi:hypothetical protein